MAPAEEHMAFERWTPRQDHTKQEEFLLRRLRRTRKLFAFLRDHRQELFDDAFQAELESMYRDTGAGQEPVAPALLAMIVLLQSYLGVSDAEAVELTVVDLRWQMVLDRLGATTPACGQGTLVDFRGRLIRTDMDRRLLERTVELARQTKAFDWKKLPKDLRVAIDSSPLAGAGRVEDTINLLGHAARKVVECAAELLRWTVDRVAREAGIPALLEASVKRALDTEMRHGRKSKSKRFDGYKRHIATDLDTDLILACAVTPANRPEEEAAPMLKADLERQGRRIAEMHVDRGYIASPVVGEVLAAGGAVICKPWVARNGKLFTKTDFKINMRDRTITCPAGQVEPIDLGADVEFDPQACARCRLRAKCTTAASGSGRTVTIADDELLQHKLRKLMSTPSGRERLRERVVIEHRLAHLGRRQGRHARYRGTRKNLFDVRRAAAILNLEVIDRRIVAALPHQRAA
jgi:hypothetical protein